MNALLYGLQALFWLIVFLCASAIAFSSPQVLFSFPVDCKLHTECTIQNYFDHDLSHRFRDYRCGHLAYDAHDGTDIRIPNLGTMRQGVTVLAAADGIVRATRDRMPDVSVRTAGRTRVKGVEAGNAVVLRHGDDWETQYSHLKQGSVLVQPGDTVKRGDPLGLIGLSGNTEFPHVHFEVRYRGEPIDPFVGLTRNTSCGPGAAPLWTAEALEMLEYRATGLLQAGFLSSPPDKVNYAEGLPQTQELSTVAPALVFVVEIYGAQKGDIVQMQILGPEGETVATKKKQIPGNKARWASYLGRKRPKDDWRPGTYSASYLLLRPGKTRTNQILEIERRIQITDRPTHQR
jgi:murein DD-endopeptidase MepM/ murein hydrolase activator NlpD